MTEKNLQTAVEHSGAAKHEVGACCQALNDVLADRRRQRSLLVQAIQTEEQRHARARQQYADCRQVLAAATTEPDAREDEGLPA
jgi:hypothetical protein